MINWIEMTLTTTHPLTFVLLVCIMHVLPIIAIRLLVSGCVVVKVIPIHHTFVYKSVIFIVVVALVYNISLIPRPLRDFCRLFACGESLETRLVLIRVTADSCPTALTTEAPPK